MEEASKDLEELNAKAFKTELDREIEGFDKRMEMEQAIADFRKEEAGRAARESAEQWKAFFKDAFVTMALTGELSFRKLGQALVANLLNQQVMRLIDQLFAMGGSSSGFGWLGSALGGLFGGGGSFGGGGGTSVPGFQHGGAFTVPGSGGADSQLVAFRATPREHVTVSAAGSSSSEAPHISLTINNDNRGATQELIRALPEHDRRLADQIETRIVTKLQRRQYELR